MAPRVLGERARCSHRESALRHPQGPGRRSLRAGRKQGPRRRWRGRALVAAALAEQRRSIARDVHDGIAQELAFIAGQLQRLDQTATDPALVRELQAASRRALAEARLTVEVLGCDDVPVERLVERLIAGFEHRFGIAVDLDLRTVAALDRERRTAVLRVLSQAITNAVDHGEARRMRVRLDSGETGVSLRVADDGSGFDTERVGRGFGLVSMRERVEVLGGRFSVVSRPGEGTEVTAVLP